METYSNSQLLPHLGCDEPQHDPPDSNSHPEPRRSHATSKFFGVTHFKHEFDDPSSQRDFDAHVAEQEHGTEPRNACIRETNECFLHTIVFRIGGASIIRAEDGAGCGPEGGCGCYEFDCGHGDLDLLLDTTGVRKIW
jgi:hypothetical protein